MRHDASPTSGHGPKLQTHQAPAAAAHLPLKSSKGTVRRPGCVSRRFGSQTRLEHGVGGARARGAIQDLCSSMSILSQATDVLATFSTRKPTRTSPSPVAKRSPTCWEQRPSEAATYVTVMVPMLSPCKKNDFTRKKVERH